MDDYVHSAACHERKEAIDQRFRRDKEAIDAINENMATLTELVSRLAAMQEVSAKDMSDHEKRLRTLEQAPAGKWDRLGGYITAALASGLIGYLLSGLVG